MHVLKGFKIIADLYNLWNLNIAVYIVISTNKACNDQ